MKTIKINGVEFRVTRETSDTTVDQHYRFGVEPSGRGSFNVNQIIDATAPGVEVSISGHPDAVKGLFVTPSDPHSLIQRALSALGYVVGDHEKDVAQFSQWIDHLVKFPQSEEALGLWTNATLARLHATRSVDEASKDAQAIVIQRMRLFPPAPKTGLDDGPEIPRHIAEAQYAELQEWRSSANQRGWNSPLDMRGRTAADDVELGEWRSSASAFDIHSPKELASLTNVSFGELLDRKRRIELRNATGCETLDGVAELIRKLRAENGDREACWRNATGRVSPEDAKARIDRLQKIEDYANACATSAKPKHPLISAIENAPVVPISDEENVKLDEIAKSSRWLTDEEFKKSVPVWGQVPNAGEVVFAVSQSTLDQMSKKNQALWQEATGCPDPATAKERIKQLRTGYDSADAERSQLKRDAEQRERAWIDATGRKCPGDAEQRIDDLESKVSDLESDVRVWEKATKCKSPEDAGKLDELAKTWQDSSTRYEYIAKQRAREISEWAAKSGVASPDALVEKFRVTEDAWKEATGAADTHTAYKKIADLESKLLSYASEIDALRKLASPKRDWDAELGLAGAEHRMRVAAERELAKAKAELDSKRRECQTEKERADENARTTTARGILLDKIAEALGCDFNHDSLPEHVADLKRAHDNANDSLVGSDDLANETKEIASILASQLKDAGIGSAAGAIAARSVFLSAVWAKSRLAREILLGGTGESIVDATKRVMDRCASLEQQIIADDNRTDELRKILHAKEGESVIEVAKRFAEQLSTSERASNLFETAIVGARKAAGIDQQKPGSGNYVSLTEWCQDAREKLSHAIIPLPKPEKVEAGQRWAFVMKAIEKGSSPPRVVGTFIDSNGSSWCAYQSDLDTGLYLGT